MNGVFVFDLIHCGHIAKTWRGAPQMIGGCYVEKQ